MPDTVVMYFVVSVFFAFATAVSALIGRLLLRRFPLPGWTIVGVLTVAALAPFLGASVRVPWLGAVGAAAALLPMLAVQFFTEFSGSEAFAWSIIIGFWIGARSRGKFFSSSIFRPAFVLGIVLAGAILFFNGLDFFPEAAKEQPRNVFLDPAGPLQPMQLDDR